MLKKIINLLSKPFILLPLMMVVLVLLWQGYIDQSKKSPELNYIKNSLLRNGSFEQVDNNDKPIDWNVSAYGSLNVAAHASKGYNSEHGLYLEVNDQKNGLAAISSAKVSVQANKKYFFKAYYLTDTEFDLLVRYYYKDGSEKLVWLQNYPDFDFPWSTMSSVIQPDNSVEALSMVMQMSSDGYLQLDDAYLAQVDYAAPQACEGANIIKNTDLTVWDYRNKQPAGWKQYKDGVSNTGLAAIAEGNKRFLRLDTSDYQSGSARWKHLPVKIAPYQQFCLTFDYRSKVDPEILIEYTLADKSKKFVSLSKLAPSVDWTRRSAVFETPAGATDIVVSINLKNDGQVDSSDYQLVKLQDSATFARPLASITFDDGWKSSYLEGAHMIEDYDMNATFYINPDAIDQEHFITQKDLHDLQRRHFEIASHGLEHFDMTSLSVEQLQHQLNDSRNYLDKKLGMKVTNFATPYGKHDPQTDHYIRSAYKTHRGTDEGINTRLNYDPYNLKVVFIMKNTRITYIKQQLEAAQASNGWIIFVYHEINNDDNKFSVNSDTFLRQLTAITQSKIPVLTVQEATKELQSQL